MIGPCFTFNAGSVSTLTLRNELTAPSGELEVRRSTVEPFILVICHDEQQTRRHMRYEILASECMCLCWADLCKRRFAHQHLPASQQHQHPPAWSVALSHHASCPCACAAVDRHALACHC